MTFIKKAIISLKYLRDNFIFMYPFLFCNVFDSMLIDLVLYRVLFFSQAQHAQFKRGIEQLVSPSHKHDGSSKRAKGGDTSLPVLAADDFFPIFVYVLIHADIKHPETVRKHMYVTHLSAPQCSAIVFLIMYSLRSLDCILS